ncbi:MAG: hypothetical protein ACJA1A_001153 [Saprospiraceae bacterium]|jgi:hypothetical protein
MMIQIKNLRNFGFAFLAMLAFSFTSCNKEAELVDIESFTDSSIEKLQGGAMGKSACLELIFPVSIQFVDESTAEVADYKNLHETIVNWFTENDVEKSKENKPQLVFPIQVLNEEGEIIDVDSHEALIELKKECPKRGECKGKNGRGFKCFSLVFPITITLDGADVTFDNRMALKAAVRAYKMEAGDDAVRPTLVFPITVEYDDETQVTVNSKEELQALKRDCREEG